MLKAKLPALTFDSPSLSTAEQLRANHFAHECKNPDRLTRGHANVLTEIARRETVAAHQRSQNALRATLRHLRPASFWSHYPGKPQPALTGVPGASLPNCADRRVGTLDRRAAARFQPADSLTFAHLLSNQSR